MDCDLIAALRRQPLNDAHLLRILCAEVGLVGANEVKEPRDYGGHAREVSRPGGTLKSCCEWTWINGCDWFIGRIDFVDRWSEN